MESTYVSSKGQVVIPKAIRDAAGLRVGTRLKVTLKEDGILLTPVRAATVDALYGRFKGQDFIADLEAEQGRKLGSGLLSKLYDRFKQCLWRSF